MSQSTKIICELISVPLPPRQTFASREEASPPTTQRAYLTLELVQVLDGLDLVVIAVVDGLCNLPVPNVHTLSAGAQPRPKHADVRAATARADMIMGRKKGAGTTTSWSVKPSITMPRVRLDPPHPPAAGVPGISTLEQTRPSSRHVKIAVDLFSRNGFFFQCRQGRQSHEPEKKLPTSSKLARGRVCPQVRSVLA
jgi:hypothetical protein